MHLLKDPFFSYIISQHRLSELCFVELILCLLRENVKGGQCAGLLARLSRTFSVLGASTSDQREREGCVGGANFPHLVEHSLSRVFIL